jgi:hypothetical protein
MSEFEKELERYHSAIESERGNRFLIGHPERKAWHDTKQGARVVGSKIASVVKPIQAFVFDHGYFLKDPKDRYGNYQAKEYNPEDARENTQVEIPKINELLYFFESDLRTLESKYANNQYNTYDLLTDIKYLCKLMILYYNDIIDVSWDISLPSVRNDMKKVWIHANSLLETFLDKNKNVKNTIIDKVDYKKVKSIQQKMNILPGITGGTRKRKTNKKRKTTKKRKTNKTRK